MVDGWLVFLFDLFLMVMSGGMEVKIEGMFTEGKRKVKNRWMSLRTC